MNLLWGRCIAFAKVLRLATLQLVGRRFWLFPLFPLAWPLFQIVLLLTGGNREPFEPLAAQNTLIGMPMAVLALFLGARVIAGEIESRSLEIAYTVPGGTERLWLLRLAAAWLLVVASGLLLALVTFVFLTPFPPMALYGAIQGATFYLVLSMGMAALFRSEVAGLIATAAVLGLNLLLSQLLISPFWNPLSRPNADAAQLFESAVKNRLGFLIVCFFLVALAFARAARREKMLS